MAALSSLKWQHWAALTGAAAVIGAISYYVLTDSEADDSESSALSAEDSVPWQAKDKEEREKVGDILGELLANQTETKDTLRSLTKEIIQNNYDFKKAYERVKDVHPKDPLERHGISMQQFDDLLEKYANDQEIRTLISRVMSAAPTISKEKVQDITIETVMKIHSLMLNELERLVEEFQSISDRHSYDMKSVVIATQAMVGAKVEETFNVTSDEVEASVYEHHPVLAKSREFTRMNISISAKMSQLMGAQSWPPS